VDGKGNEQCIWLALNVGTREIVCCYIGDCSGNPAQPKLYGEVFLLLIVGVQ